MQAGTCTLNELAWWECGNSAWLEARRQVPVLAQLPQQLAGLRQVIYLLDLDFCGWIVKELEWIFLSIKCDTYEEAGMWKIPHALHLFLVTHCAHGHVITEKSLPCGLTKNFLTHCDQRTL